MHSFLAFDVDATDLSVSKAVLQINVASHSYVIDDPSETFAVVDVTSNIDTLLAGGEQGTPGLGGIWDDLGEGHVYGSRTFTSSEDGTLVEIKDHSAYRHEVELELVTQGCRGSRRETPVGLQPREVPSATVGRFLLSAEDGPAQATYRSVQGAGVDAP